MAQQDNALHIDGRALMNVMFVTKDLLNQATSMTPRVGVLRQKRLTANFMPAMRFTRKKFKRHNTRRPWKTNLIPISCSQKDF